MAVVGHWLGRAVCVGVGYVYPLYASTEAIQRCERHEMLQWITFWFVRDGGGAVNALFVCFELVGDKVIGWMPFYYEAKIAFLAWLALPAFHGAKMLHEKWIAPMFELHEEVINTTLDEFKRRASEKVTQVAKDTAALALQKSSGMLLQGQQYMAAQLVQQVFLNQLSPTSSSADSKAADVSTARREEKDKVAEPSKPTHVTEKTDSTPPTGQTGRQDGPKRPTSPSLSNHAATTAGTATASSKETRATGNMAVPPPPAPSSAATLPTVATARQEKGKELVAHFKKLLVNGFQLKYHPSAGVEKLRVLRLQQLQARHVMFETGSSGAPRKAVKLSILNIRRITNAVQEESAGTVDAALLAELDLDRAFLLDNGKARLIFTAETQKTRDLLVAGMRLLVNERKRLELDALVALTRVHSKLRQQQAFDHMLQTLWYQPQSRK
ncbi:TPA: hypothetical protein N0F65_009453 [Lagenidium giganteum]|uniref:HVA22-like protein n=1 Tax=Lagenidium giganteum TaxID=4803 RepID=A0AAV2ZHA6_9STRA|nr:TPA: hypothetical protein N0F65_009453 [Lagenidium giganteum]